MFRSPALLLLSLVACTGDTSKEPVFELCNGVDDNKDGQIDEGYDDVDADGIADCIDAACEVKTIAPGVVEVDEACVAEEPDTGDGTELVLEWTSDSAGGGTFMTLPTIGELTDDDGDGEVDLDDVPDICVVDFLGTMTLYDGATGEVHWSRDDFTYFPGTAIADANGDGASEIISFNEDFRVVALNGDGATLWESEPFPGALSSFPLVADLDGDGAAEIIYGSAVLNGDDGALVSTLSSTSTAWTTPTVADLDQDGEQEILYGGSVLHKDGTLLWTGRSSSFAFYTAPIDTDGDGLAEVLWLTDNAALLYTFDGTLIDEFDLEVDYPAPPCVADLDGDGEAEVGLPMEGELVAFELDGTELWRVPNDDTGSASCSAFDFDGDGAMELVLANQSAVLVYEGATGEIRYSSDDHYSGTFIEYAAVADVDADGEAEIVTINNRESGGAVDVFGSPGDPWEDARRIWPMHGYTETNVDEDGAIPAEPDAPWESGGSVHVQGRSRRGAMRAEDTGGGDTGSEDGGLSPNLSVEDLDWCVDACPAGTLTAVVQVANRGPVDVEAGQILTLYAVSGEDRYAMATATLDAVPAGVALGGVTLSAPASSFGPEGFVVRVGDEGGPLECDLEDNERRSGEPVCPLGD